jgi:epidermal growth factor receptor substrate 15
MLEFGNCLCLVDVFSTAFQMLNVNTHTSDKPTTTPPTNFKNLSSSNVDDIFGSAGAAAGSASRPTTAATTSKGAFDDLDDDFEGLEDAKEGSADDDFATISRSGLDDFNPVFDSSPPPSQPKSDSAHTAAAFGTESSFDFASLSGASVAGSTTGPAAGPSASAATAQVSAAAGGAKPSQTAESHDWDALFAGLDSATTPTASSHTLATSSANINEPTTTAAGAAGNASGSGSGSGDARPAAPGRALTEEGEHDDPILKNLTGMGYSRPDALAALEKYDYNLERVSMHHPSTKFDMDMDVSGKGGKVGRGRRVRV